MKTITNLGTPMTVPAYDMNWLMKDEQDKKTIHVAGIGRVGSTLLMGLKLLGRRELKEIGLFDLNDNTCLRWEMELNQVMEGCSEEPSPEVKILTDEALFDCDVFMFCIARAVPEISDKKIDVRLAQLEANGAIVRAYAKKAADRGFKGLFVVVSDPVDLLCREAFAASQEGAHPFHPYQVTGLGLGVMNARAAYYAKKEGLPRYLTEGRVFGPHGAMLVVADSLDENHYSEGDSDRLQKLTTMANMAMRELGHLPYTAPALSSGAYTILRILRGEWNYSANYLNGVYFGAKNRSAGDHVEWENEPLPDKLFAKLETVYASLRDFRA
ncbi:MAG: lactate dehydrogenase [Lachnospiraceae bacterium]|nr:lactate dehydrogenase [Lachnospiraceae bacterium]